MLLKKSIQDVKLWEETIYFSAVQDYCPKPGVSNPAPGELPSYRFQLQPQSNTPEPANQGLQGYLLISDRYVGAGLELKSARW